MGELDKMHMSLSFFSFSTMRARVTHILESFARNRAKYALSRLHASWRGSLN